MGSHLLKKPAPYWIRGDLSAEADQRNTNHCRIRVGSAAGSVQSRACGAKEPWGSRISTQRMGTGGLPERYQTAVREVSSTVRVAPVIPGHRGAGPGCLGLVKEGFERGPARTFERWTTVLSRLTGWRRCIESGVQAQTGDQGDRLGQGLAAMEQVQHGIAVVAHQHQRT